jgi:hypothetical protein
MCDPRFGDARYGGQLKRCCVQLSAAAWCYQFEREHNHGGQRPTLDRFGSAVVTKKVLVLGTVLFAGMVMLVVASSRDGRIAYHKWRLTSAIQKARTAGAGKPTAGQELLALLRGRPATTEDYLAAWHRHEDALVELNYLARREFAVSHQPDTEERMRISEAAEKVFPGPQLWSIAKSPSNDYAVVSNDYAVVVTAPLPDMVQWEQLIYRLEEEAQVTRRFGYIESRPVSL